MRSVRVAALITAVLVLVVALGIRATADGAIAQISGTALYASLIYAGVVFVAPRLAPWVSGAIAVAFCWAVEFSQLTGLPADLSERSVMARLVLGAQFDLADVAWYPAGVIPLVALHALLASVYRPAVGAARDY